MTQPTVALLRDALARLEAINDMSLTVLDMFNGTDADDSVIAQIVLELKHIWTASDLGTRQLRLMLDALVTEAQQRHPSNGNVIPIRGD